MWPGLTSILKVKLKNPSSIPDKSDVLFRYDPPVLIIYVRWHENEQSVGKILRDLLYLSYAGNEDSVSIQAYSMSV